MLSGTAGDDRFPPRPTVVRRVWEMCAAMLLVLTIGGSGAWYYVQRVQQEQATIELAEFLSEGFLRMHDMARLRRLVEAGAYPNYQNSDGVNATMLAVVGRDADVVRELASRGADVNAPDHRGLTPLIYASVWNNEEQVIPVLLAAGAAVDARERSGRTALFNAVELRHAGAVRLLAEAKADPNVTLGKAEGGQSILTAAAEQGDPEIIAILLEHGADVNQPDARRRTPLQWAVRNHHWAAARLLRAHGARR